MPKKARQPLDTMTVLKWIGIAAIAGLIIAGIRISSMKAAMKSIHSQAAANNYIRQNSMNITGASEVFLYSNVNRVRRESESSGGSSTHTSSSGSSHGGGGRSF